jgi:opacity protein-like surface antigen
MRQRRWMSSMIATGLALSLALAVTAVEAGAQELRSVQLGVAAGVSLPTGQLSGEVDPGFRVGGSVTLHDRSRPVGLRGSLSYDRLSDSAGSIDRSIRSGVVDLLYRLPGMVATPYLLAGAGAFSIAESHSDEVEGRRTRFGFDVGAGLDFRTRGANTFLEARWQSIATDIQSTRLIALTIGVRR